MLTIQAVPMAELMPLLGILANDKTDTSAGATSVAQALANSQGFRVDLDGSPVLGYALQFNQHDKRVCWITAAAGQAIGTDLTAQVLPMIEQQARAAGAQQIAITTKRGGLGKKITAQGFQESGVTYRKNLQ